MLSCWDIRQCYNTTYYQNQTQDKMYILKYINYWKNGGDYLSSPSSSLSVSSVSSPKDLSCSISSWANIDYKISSWDLSDTYTLLCLLILTLLFSRLPFLTNIWHFFLVWNNSLHHINCGWTWWIILHFSLLFWVKKLCIQALSPVCWLLP